jgi:hypothetical protein
LWDNAWAEFIPFLDYGSCRRFADALIGPGEDLVCATSAGRKVDEVGDFACCGAAHLGCSLGDVQQGGFEAGAVRGVDAPVDRERVLKVVDAVVVAALAQETVADAF